MDAPRGVVAVLSDALCLACRSRKHMLPCLLVALIPSSLLLLDPHASVSSHLLGFVARLHALGREHPATPQFYDLLVHLKADAGAATTRVNAARAAASFVGRLAATCAVVHAASAACAGRHLPVRDLLVKMAASWKAPLVTSLYATLLSVGYTVLSMSLVAVPALNTIAAAGYGGPSCRLAVVFAVCVAAAARFLYIYLAMVWTVGVVLAVLEDGCHGGLEALHRAGEVVRGRRAQGFLIAMVLALGDAAVGSGGGGKRRWSGAFACAAQLVLWMFSPMVYTVFYHECKRSHCDGATREVSRHKEVDGDHGTSRAESAV
ncbi:hypothetical protein QOZ80_8AG0632560 [Eleusine coracana subsp. coracana]|nr:hypothetical protein QOZ80_8AG0632560 [Eleusine coracana subsp. coracana]